uniref:Putative heat shock protein n=1 Tax=Chaetomium thermophilum (strain DSM 1495 / CBS 144.50 / IMI 039719) TaxID=759272 RepID=UPI001411B244|nr:Chain A, Putative heat shock protein [Thermochaetoides thermophila DSM 1495]6SR6_C Chain C, Putative heat shock protein [Thermochaetoides thermophila DSM 1495]
SAMGWSHPQFEKAESASKAAPGERVVIGITFGNSNSSIAHTVDDKAEVIANEDGDRQIPTILSYVDGDEYYGQQAKNFLVRNPKNTVAYFRDILGQDFKSVDPTHNHASAHPQEAGDNVVFTIKDKAEEDAEPSTLTVSEIATRYLRRLVGAASEYLGKKVTSAVITIPTNFTEKQKAALIAAAAAADLEVLQLISEPAAAVLAYDARPEATISDKIIVVADLGGSRSDVTVLASRSGMYTILATVHDYEYHGIALDKVLIDHFSKEFLKKNPGAKDPRENPRSLAKLRLEAESTKRALSRSTNASFSVESLIDGLDFASTINRLRYETIARTVFEGFNRLVESAVKKAGLDPLDVDEVIMSGGTSNTPRIAANFRYIFPESTRILAPSTDPSALNPSELQARGAALQASLIQEFETEDIEQSTHAAVTTMPHVTNAIGVVSVSESGEEKFVPIIAPETAVPARRTVHLDAPKEGGDVLVKVVEGSTHINVIKPEPKAKEDGETKEKTEDADDDGDFDDDDEEEEEEEEEEEKREKVWKIGSTLAEAAVRGVKKGAKVEVTINVNTDLTVIVTAREVGGKGGVRGTLSA